VDEAKKIFCEYSGSYYQMHRDGVYEQYKSYKIPQVVENEWLEEIFTDLRVKIEVEKNKRKLTEYFEKYVFTATQGRDNKAMQYAMELLEIQAPFLDTNSLYRWINIILNHYLLKSNLPLKRELVEKMLNLLKNLLEKPIIISEDYKEKGSYPDYLTKEKLIRNIQNAINYGERWLVKQI